MCTENYRHIQVNRVYLNFRLHRPDLGLALPGLPAIRQFLGRCIELFPSHFVLQIVQCLIGRHVWRGGRRLRRRRSLGPLRGLMLSLRNRQLRHHRILQQIRWTSPNDMGAFLDSSSAFGESSTQPTSFTLLLSVDTLI